MLLRWFRSLSHEVSLQVLQTVQAGSSKLLQIPAQLDMQGIEYRFCSRKCPRTGALTCTIKSKPKLQDGCSCVRGNPAALAVPPTLLQTFPDLVTLSRLQCQSFLAFGPTCNQELRAPCHTYCHMLLIPPAKLCKHLA